MGMEIVVDSLEDMCDLMCNNKIPAKKEDKRMDKVMHDVRVYANDVVERLIALKDMNRDKLSISEIDTLNDAANLIYHNIKEIVRE